MNYLIIFLVVLVIIIAVFIKSTSGYYNKIFNAEHYSEIIYWAVDMVHQEIVENPSIDDCSVIITQAGIRIVFTRTSSEGGDTLHFSISQQDRPTTHAVGERIIFLLMTLLNKNKCEANMFYTQSTVHHLVLNRQNIEEWITNPVEQVILNMAEYRPLHLPLERY